MPVYEINGQRVQFDHEPSHEDIDFAAKALGNESKPKPMFSSIEEAQAANEKQKREQFNLEAQATPLGIADKAVANTVNPFVNAATFGLPDLISKKVLKKPFVSEEAQMKWLSEPAGMMMGGAGKLATETATAAVPVVKGGIRMMENGIPKVIKETVGRKMARGAVTGGVAGATQLSPDEEGNISVGQQAAQGAGGAVIGSLAIPAEKSFKGVGDFLKKTPIGAFISKAGNVYEKWKAGAKTPVSEKLTKKIGEQQQAITLNSAERNSAQKGLDERFSSDLEEAKRVLQNNFDNLSKEFQESAETGAVKLQDSAKFVSNEMTDSYGGQLGDISKELSASGNQIRNSEVSDLIKQTRANLQDNLITSGHVVDTLDKMEAKYGLKMIGERGKFNSVATGENVGGPVRSNADDIVDFERFIKDIKDIKKGIKFGAKTEDNVALGIFYDDLTSYLGQRPGLEKYSELNKAYTPYIQALKTIVKQTKAYAGESETQQATNLLKRFGLRKADVTPIGSGIGTPAEASTVRNIERLQQPSQFSKGMGTEMTDPVVAKAQELAKAKQAIEDIHNIIASQKKNSSKALDQKFMKELDTITGTNKYIESDYTLKEAMVKDALASKLKRIGYQQDKIDFILKDRQKVMDMLKLIGGGTVGVGSVLAIGNAIGKATRGR